MHAQSDTLRLDINISSITRALESTLFEGEADSVSNLENEETIYLPYENGQLKAFKMQEYYMVPIGLRKEIQTYHGYMIDDPSIGCRLTRANGQISVSMQSATQTLILEKNKSVSKENAYLLFQGNLNPEECGVEDFHKIKEEVSSSSSILFSSHGTELRTYRLAILATNSLYTAGGGNDASVNSYIATIVNNINALFEKEIAVRFSLISPNNPVSTNVFYQYGGSTSLYNIRLENDTRFGNGNFDVGHCIRPSGGGVAYIGVVCNSSFKGGGLSGVSPSSTSVFAHELGHQFNAGHTFNGNGTGNCGPANRSYWDAIEPGSGNSIMSYSGSCTPYAYNIIGEVANYFHNRSLTTMIQHITSRGPGCGVVSNTGNMPPVVNLASSFTIPKGTPFTLKGTAIDAIGEDLSYTWEQYDFASISDTGSLGNTSNNLGLSAVNSVTAPLFRTVQSTNGKRTFPNISYILNNSNNPPDNVGEDLPLVARTMNFRLTVRDNRDNGGGVAYESVAVTVSNEGPLEVSSQNTQTVLSAGSVMPITWNVNGTNNLSPNVKILLSIDGGFSFPIILSSSTLNDGSESILIPSNTPATALARIKISSVSSSDYEWFDINDVNFSVTSSCSVYTSRIYPADKVSGVVGDATFNLNLSGFIGAKLTNDAFFTDFSNTTSVPFLSVSNPVTGACQEGAVSNAAVLEFQVTKTGYYSLGMSETTGVFVTTSPNPSCASFFGSNNVGGFYYSGFSKVYNTFTTYYLFVVDVFSNGDANITINGVGDVLQVLPDPVGFSSTYIAIDESTGIISALSNTSDFTVLGGGDFVVKGLAYENGVTPSSFLGSTESAAFATGSCISFSSNSKDLQIVGTPCPNLITLSSITNDINSGTQNYQSSNNINPGSIIATNIITGGNVVYDAGNKVELNPGFTAEGTVFTAKIGGCN